MKNFTKVCLIMTAVLAVIGTIFLLIAGIGGGRDIYRTIINRGYHHNLVNIRPYYGSDLVINGNQMPENDGYSDILSAENVNKLDFSIGITEFHIEERSDNENSFEIIISGYGECDYFIEDNTLYIEGFREEQKITRDINIFGNGITWDNNQITLYIPKNIKFEDVNIEVGAGRIYGNNIAASSIIGEVGAGEMVMDNISAEDLQINVGAGRAEFNNTNVNNLDMSINVGKGTFDGAISGDIDITCDVGSTQIDLNQAESDFNYILSCGVGSIDIDQYRYNGLDVTRHIDNNANQDFKIDCSIGSVEIDFY